MAAQTDALRSEVLALPEARAQLAVDLLDSLDNRPIDTDQAELDRIWADETARRAQQIDSGEVTTDSWDDVLARVNKARRPCEVRHVASRRGTHAADRDILARSIGS